jgi:hypothetical protein
MPFVDRSAAPGPALPLVLRQPAEDAVAEDLQRGVLVVPPPHREELGRRFAGSRSGRSTTPSKRKLRAASGTSATPIPAPTSASIVCAWLMCCTWCGATPAAWNSPASRS